MRNIFAASLFKKSEAGFYVICPFGSIVGLAVVTPHEHEWKRGKLICSIALSLMILALAFYRQVYDPASGLEKWKVYCAIGMSAIVFIYFGIAVFFKEFVFYRESVHGSLLKKI